MKTMLHPSARAVLVAGAAILASVPVHAGTTSLLSAAQQAAANTPSRQRSWTLGEYSEVRLVAIEAGATPNQHPARLPLEMLMAQLRTVRTPTGAVDVPLFGESELKDLVEPLAKALAAAIPTEDVVLVSSSRRDDGSFFVPSAVTARFFVQNGALQMIVRDARLDFYDKARGTHTRPNFEFGARATAGSAVLHSTAATAKRSDWLEIPLTMPAAAAPVAVLPAAAAAPAPAVAPAAPRPRAPWSADEIEQRLLTLNRLRERGLISEEEYQQKRKEILSQL